jgi:WD40 repeat protein
LVFILKGHSHPVTALMLDQQNDLLLSLSHEIIEWDVTRKTIVRQSNHTRRLTHICPFGANGFIVADSHSHLLCYDRKELKKMMEFENTIRFLLCIKDSIILIAFEKRVEVRFLKRFGI